MKLLKISLSALVVWVSFGLLIYLMAFNTAPYIAHSLKPRPAVKQAEKHIRKAESYVRARKYAEAAKRCRMAAICYEVAAETDD